LPRPNKSDVTRNALSNAVEVEVRRQKGTVVDAFANAVAKNVRRANNANGRNDGPVPPLPTYSRR
jgi:hypothetical protein